MYCYFVLVLVLVLVLKMPVLVSVLVLTLLVLALVSVSELPVLTTRLLVIRFTISLHVSFYGRVFGVGGSNSAISNWTKFNRHMYRVAKKVITCY